MDKLKALREELGKAIDEMEKHADAGGEAYDAAKKNAEDLKAKIARLEDTEREKAASAKPITPAAAGAVSAQPKAAKIPGQDVSRMIRALAATKGIPQLAADFAAKQWGPEGEDVAKALSAGTGASGGFLVPETQSQEIIELLRARTVVTRAGARPVPLPNGNLSQSRVNAGSSAAYIGENQNITKTQPSLGQLKLTARKLAAIVPISNDLIRFASPQVDTLVRDDLLDSMQVTGDAAMLFGDGSGPGPKGIRYWAAPTVSQVIPANVTVNLANVTTDLGKIELALMNANTPMLKPGYVMAPRTINYLRNLRDTNGVLAFPEVNQSFQMTDPTKPTCILRGFPVWSSTTVPVNLGGGSNESTIMFVDFSEVVVGEVPGILIDASDTAAYFDGSGVVAAFSQDQTVIRAILQHDLGMRHDTSAAVLTGVTWA